MRYSVVLSYAGAGFCGWQRQPSEPSVQECLETALGKLLGGTIPVIGAGRTDTGVNAIGYVACFDGPEGLTADDFRYKLNAILPRSVAVHSVIPTNGDFHARFSATQRSYTYFIHRKKDPFVAAYSWQCGFPELDFEAMNLACRYLLGTHDFRCFEKTGGANKTSRCTVTEAFWKPYTPTHVQIMDNNSLILPESFALMTGRSEEEGVVSETCGHPRPHKREGPTACGGRGREATVSETIPSSGEKPPYWYFRVSADRFLRNMVRAIVGTLIEVGRGKHDPVWVNELIESGTRGDAGESVPGHALFLSKVKY